MNARISWCNERRDAAFTAAILSDLVRMHKHEVRLINEYHAVNRACKKVISKLIPKKVYKSLLIRIIGFARSQASIS